MKTTKAVFGILTITIALAFQVQAQSFLTNGLVAYYPFNGNVNDASGNGHNGTVEGAVLTTDRFGNSNAAYYFDGSSVIDIPTSTNFDVYPAQGITVAVWAYPSIYLYPEHLVGKRQDPSPFWQLAIGPAALNPVPIGQWIHITITKTSAYETYYTNGVFAQDYSVSWTTPITNSADVLIGGSSDFAKFVGNLDEVRIYNRGLSTNEIQQLYAYESQPIVTLKKAVKPSFSNLFLGTNYQLQVSADLSTWTNSGSAFAPTNSVMDYPQYFDVDDWGQLFFRLQEAP